MPRLYSVRKRDLLFLVLTTSIAGAYFFAGRYVADYVGTMNSARIVGALMTARVEQAPRLGTSAIGQIFGGIGVRNGPTPEEKAANERLQRQVVTVEAVVYGWRYMMQVLAGVLALTALLAAVTARLRRWQLLAATAIGLSTAGTIVGFWLLVKPDWGGMPPLQPATYVLVPTAQGLYGLILLLAYARRMPQLPSPTDQQPAVESA